MSTSEATQLPRRSGFDVILGNPPWERVKLQDQEFFAQRDPAVADAPNASTRKKAIAALKDTNPTLLADFERASRQAEGESHLMRSSGRYPLCGRGDINTYTVFSELAASHIASCGRAGVIVPLGILVGEQQAVFFWELLNTGRLIQSLGCDNEYKEFFPAVDNNVVFTALTIGDAAKQPAVFAFDIRRFSELDNIDRRFTLTPEDINRLNPQSHTCPVFRSRRDANIVLSAHASLPALSKGSGWSARYLRMFDMASDSGHFLSAEACEQLGLDRIDNCYCGPSGRFVPLYEAKMIWHFEHRWASFLGDAGRSLGRVSRKYEGWYGVNYSDPSDFAVGRYWVNDATVTSRLPAEIQFVVAYRDITNRDLERTAVFAILPRVAIGHQAPIVLLNAATPHSLACFVAERNSVIADFIVRNKIGGSHLSFFILDQLPTLPAATYDTMTSFAAGTTWKAWIAARVLELTYTSHDLRDFARAIGHTGPPFVWDDARRRVIRAELDAAFFHLYGISRDDAAYIMDTFLVFKARDEERNGGVYKTKETILAIYDEMAEAMAGATPVPAIRPTLAGTPAFLPPTTAQVQQGRAVAYVTLLAATWNKPVERQAIEYGLVLMLNDALRAKVLAQPRTGSDTGIIPAKPLAGAARHSPVGSPTQYVRGLDVMLGSLHANNMLKVTDSGLGGGGMQRIELGAKGAAMAQTLSQTDRAKVKDAVAAFEILKANLLQMESFAAVTDLEFSVV